MRRGERRRVRRVHDLRLGVHQLEEARGRTIGGAEELGRLRQRHHGLEARHRGERDRGEDDAVEPAVGDEGDREGEHRNPRQAGAQCDEGGVDAPHLREALRGTVELTARREGPGAVPVALAEDEQVGDAADLVDEQRVRLRPRGDDRSGRPAGQPSRGERQDDAGDREEHEEREAEHGVERPEEERRHERDQRGDDRRHEHAHVQVLERVDVGDDAREQVAAVECRQASGRERLDRAVEPRPQPGEDPERRPVGGVPLEVAQDRPRDREDPDRRDREGDRGDVRDDRRLRDEVGRDGHEPDARRDRGGAEERADHDPPPVARHETELAPERAHDPPSASISTSLRYGPARTRSSAGGPASIARPPARTTTVSARAASRSRWEMTRTVRRRASRSTARGDRTLAHRVEMGRHLVEDHERGVAQERPRERDPLLLAAGEPGAVLAQRRRVAEGQGTDELVGAGLARGRLHLRVRRARAREPDVVGDRPCEQVRGLRDPRDGASPCIDGDGGKRDAIHRDRARVRIEEAEQQARDRGLPGARLPDERDGVAGRHLQVQAPKGGAAPVLVRDVHALEADRGRRQGRGRGGIGSGGHDVVTRGRDTAPAAASARRRQPERRGSRASASPLRSRPPRRGTGLPAAAAAGRTRGPG